MADHSKPTLTSAYADFVAELDARLDDLAYWLDPAVTTATNVPTNSIRWSSGAAKWQKYNGSTWADLAALYAINISGNAATVTNGVYTTGTYSDPAWITTLAGSKISGGISGNAASATVLATARTINGVSFNGSSNISVNLNNNLTFNNTGSGSASGVNFNGGTATTISYNTVGAPSATGAGASGTWAIDISGNAATATTVFSTLAINKGGTGLTSPGAAGYVLKSTGTDFVMALPTAATGGGTDAIFVLNGQTVTTNYTLPTGQNAMSAGPITISDGITVTVPDNGNWAIV